MGYKYVTVEDGDWHEMMHRGQKMGCCSCGLVHTLDFKIEYRGKSRRPQIIMRWRQDARRTAAMRRPFKFAKEE